MDSRTKDLLKQKEESIATLQNELQIENADEVKQEKAEAKEMATLQKQNDDLVANKLSTKTHVTALEAKIGTLDAEVAKLTSELQEAKMKLSVQAEGEKTRAEQIAALRKELQEADKKLSSANKQNKSQEDTLTRLKSEIQNKKALKQKTAEQVSAACQLLKENITTITAEIKGIGIKTVQAVDVNAKLSHTIDEIRLKQKARKKEKEKARSISEDEWQECIRQYNSQEAKYERQVRNKALELIESDLTRKRFDWDSLPLCMQDINNGLRLKLFPARVVGAPEHVYDLSALERRFFKPRPSTDPDKKTEYENRDFITGTIIPREGIILESDKTLEQDIDRFLRNSTGKSRDQWMEKARLNLAKAAIPNAPLLTSSPHIFYNHKSAHKPKVKKPHGQNNKGLILPARSSMPGK